MCAWETATHGGVWHTRPVATSLTDRDRPRDASGDSGPVRASRRDRIDAQAPPRSIRRYHACRVILGLIARIYSRVRVEGMERLPAGPSVLCFSHQNWADPLYLFASIPRRPRMYFFGPEQEEMRRGLRNRLMRWGGVTVPYQPGKRGLIAATARTGSLLRQGAVVAIAGEGRIHAGEGVVMPLEDGPAYLSFRCRSTARAGWASDGSYACEWVCPSRPLAGRQPGRGLRRWRILPRRRSRPWKRSSQISRTSRGPAELAVG